MRAHGFCKWILLAVFRVFLRLHNFIVELFRDARVAADGTRVLMSHRVRRNVHVVADDCAYLSSSDILAACANIRALRVAQA